MSDPATLAFYEGEAPRYANHWPDGPGRHLPAFLDRLAAGARILELGCGGGRDAACMIARGFDVDATDGSPAMAAQAAAHLGRPVRVMRFEELGALAAYDAIWANASLLHAPRAELAGVLAAIHRALRPGGWHFASFKLGDGEDRDRIGRLYNYPDEAWLEAAYRNAGEWSEVHTAFGEGTGYEGSASQWIALSLRKAG